MDKLDGSRESGKPWLRGFVLISAAAVAVVVLALYVANMMPGMELGHHAIIALTLGIVFSTALGIGLMALIFYSNRSDRDDVVNDAAQLQRRAVAAAAAADPSRDR